MLDGNVSRREVLKHAGAVGAGAVVAMGTSAARGATPRIVGTASRAATREAQDRAESVRHTLDFGDIGTVVAGRYSDRAAEQLRERSDVRYVEADGTVRAADPGGDPPPWAGGGDGGSAGPCLPWGVDRVDADVAHANGETGAGADVAVIDTGIDPDHSDLAANVGSGKAYVECRGGSKECDGEPWADDAGHGTHCAGIAAAVDGNDEGVVGVAPGATLHAVKVLDKRGSGSVSDVAAGVKHTADQGWDVGSMSLGASSGTQTLQDACQYAYDRGVLLVAAAGNSGPCTDCVGYPAAYSTVMAVSSTTVDDALSEFSSTGPEVEIAAPGSSVFSTYDDGAYDTLSGTSMACPHVSGAGAQLMANGDTNAEARSGLTSTAEDIGLSSNESGAGLLDVASALGYASDDDGTGTC